MTWFIKLAFYLSGLPERAYSATCVGPLCNAISNLTLEEIANKIIDILLTIGGPIAAIMVLWGGFQIMTAAGDPEKFKKGRETILYAAVGFVVILAAKGVVGLIKSIFA